MKQIIDIRNTIDRLLRDIETNVEPDLKTTASICKYGIDLGKAIREHIELQRLELNLGSLMSNYGTSPSDHWKTCITQCGIAKYCISHCPHTEYLSYSKKLQLGNLLCLLDHAILDGFDPELEANVASSIKLGSNSYWFESKVTL